MGRVLLRLRYSHCRAHKVHSGWERGFLNARQSRQGRGTPPHRLPAPAAARSTAARPRISASCCVRVHGGARRPYGAASMRRRRRLAAGISSSARQARLMAASCPAVRLTRIQRRGPSRPCGSSLARAGGPAGLEARRVAHPATAACPSPPPLAADASTTSARLAAWRRAQPRPARKLPEMHPAPAPVQARCRRSAQAAC